MFEFEDDDFTLTESFSLAAVKTGYTDFEDQSLIEGTYLGDGVWVVNTEENVEEAAHSTTSVSES